MAQSEIRNFTEGNISRQLVQFATPLFLSSLLQIAYGMADMIVVGQRYGKVGISAVAVGGDVSNFLTFLAIGFSAAGQVLIAQLIGRRQEEKIGRFVGTMTGFLLTCAAVLSVVAFLMRRQLLEMMNTPPESYEGTLAYSTVCIAGLVFIYGYNIVSAVLRGMGDSRHPFVFISIAAVLNVILDIVLVLILDFGPAGAAVATVVSQAVSFLSCSAFLLHNKARFGLQVQGRDFAVWDREMLVMLLKLGIPMAIKSASVQVSKLFVNSWINSYGIAVSAFAGIANKLSAVSNLISNALNTAGSTVVGQNIAAREYERVKKTIVTLGRITFTLSATFSAVLCCFPRQVFSVFTDDAQVLEIGMRYLPIAVLMFFGAAARAMMNGLINGSGNYKVNFATAILDGIVLRIGLAVLFGLVLDMKHYGFWLGDALAGFTPFWVGILFYFSGAWKKQEKTRTT